MSPPDFRIAKTMFSFVATLLALKVAHWLTTPQLQPAGRRLAALIFALIGLVWIEAWMWVHGRQAAGERMHQSATVVPPEVVPPSTAPSPVPQSTAPRPTPVAEPKREASRPRPSPPPSPVAMSPAIVAKIEGLASRLSTIRKDPNSVSGDLRLSETHVADATILGTYHAIRGVVGSDFDVSRLPPSIREPTERLVGNYERFQKEARAFDLLVQGAVERRFAETSKNTFLPFHEMCAVYSKMLLLGRQPAEAEHVARSYNISDGGEHERMGEWLAKQPEIVTAAKNVRQVARSIDLGLSKMIFDAAVAYLDHTS